MLTIIWTFLGGPFAGFIKAFWKPIAIVLAVLFVAVAIHHRGFSAGVAKTTKKYDVIVTKANAERDSAKAALVQTEAAFALLRKEDERIKAQITAANEANKKADKEVSDRIAAIRAQVAKGNTEAERLRSLIQQQAKP
jgi:hypothetical protein